MNEIHIWLGVYESEERFQRYMKEHYSDGDDKPLNEFAADQNEIFYDHDWIESIYKSGRSAKSLLGSLSYSESFKRKASVVASDLDLTDSNAVIMIDSSEIANPTNAKGNGYKLTYLGKYSTASSNLQHSNLDKTRLDLSNQNLTSIPEYVFEMTELEFLALYRNDLTDLPEELFNLKNLEHLDIGSNRIKTLPGHFKRLEKLERIQAGSNDIVEIHSDFFEMKSLLFLNLKGNKLKSLSGEIGKLTSLEGLVLEENDLESLPDCLGGLSSLQFLNIENNQFPKTSNHLEKLTGIRRVDS